ncbi:MAG: hypothetical protein A2005_10330 [Desulfuromonadales bacterium GWC2_61_20]|nr:MAG: hypothetical protein A2005_10330 [Desulfuromonadales bacterium GWC2_61_20]HAD04297.1 GGDEF domain-containing protein [Desulfuromonas sp.]
MSTSLWSSFFPPPVRIALAYVLIAGLWIYFSDRLLLQLTNNQHQLARMATYKGLLFVLVTAGGLLLLLKKALARERQAGSAWHRSEETYRTLFEDNPQPMWVYDRESLAFLAVNDAAVSHYGYSRSEFLAMTVKDIRPAGEVAAQLENVAAVSRGIDKGGVWSHRKKDGCLISVDITSHTLVFNGRDAELVLASDVTATCQIEAQLQLRNRAMEASSNGILISSTRASGMPIIYVNQAFERMSGYAAAEILGRHLAFLGGDDSAQKGLVDIVGALHLGHAAEAVVRCARKDGSPLWIEFSVAPVRDADGTISHFVSAVNDVTERKNYEEQLEHQANHDALTGLANRNLFADRLRQSMIYARRSGRLIAVLLLDLDRFKVINDSLGHRHGDELLRQVGERLGHCVRSGDTVARLGGDEFVITLAEVAESDDIAQVTRKVTEALAMPLLVAERSLQITASIGISIFPQDSDDGETLIRNADIAMYQAKQAGGGTFRFFAREMNQRMQETMEMEADLRRALVRGELELHYQPKVDLVSGAVTGCEALLRWKHPERGMIAPQLFIPLAEETGLIVPIGQWVLRTACLEARSWQDRGLPPLVVAVNLSARQFRQPDLLATVMQTLLETELSPHVLELELTESMIVDNPEAAATTMHKLRILGVRLALDDFGTGYSSLNYLRRFPVDALKIDQSFIADVATDRGGAAVVNSVIAIAHSLGLEAVAEGVETVEQLYFLRGCHCNTLQGYLYSKPLPAGEFVALATSGRRLEW